MSVRAISTARQTLSIEQKLDIIERYERNEKTCDIVRATGIKESTLRTIRSNADRIRQTAISGAVDRNDRKRIRSKELLDMEELLAVWIDEQTKKKPGTTSMTVKQKALSIYADLKKKSVNPEEVVDFTASRGWFNRFKIRHGLRNVHLTGEVASADEGAATAFLPEMAKIIEEGGYSLDQIFNFGETRLFFKKMPERTILVAAENAPGFETWKDRVTVLLGCSASGEFRAKPLIIDRAAKQRTSDGISKDDHPGIYYKTSKNGCISAATCKEIFTDFYIPDIKNYLKTKNLCSKCIILLDDAPNHPATLNYIDPGVTFLFLPPNTTSLIQPLDQGVTATLKAYYLRRVFKMLLSGTGEENAVSVAQFWKNYNIRMAIENIVGAWSEVNQRCLRRVWKKILPNAINDCEDPEPSEQIKAIVADCVELIKKAGFEDMEQEDIEKLLGDESDDFDTEDLQELLVANSADPADTESDDTETDEHSSPHLVMSQLSKQMSVVEETLQWLERNDPDIARRQLAVRGIRLHIEPYKQLLRENGRSAKQQKLDISFEPSIESHRSPVGESSQSCDSIKYACNG